MTTIQIFRSWVRAFWPLWMLAIICGFCAHAFGADPSPTPSGSSLGGFSALIPIATLIALPLYNLFFSALAQVFSILHKQEPGWAQTLGSIGLTVTQWLSGNTPTPAAQKPPGT